MQTCRWQNRAISDGFVSSHGSVYHAIDTGQNSTWSHWIWTGSLPIGYFFGMYQMFGVFITIILNWREMNNTFHIVCKYTEKFVLDLVFSGSAKHKHYESQVESYSIRMSSIGSFETFLSCIVCLFNEITNTYNEIASLFKVSEMTVCT